jgi:hypothetical protein
MIRYFIRNGMYLNKKFGKAIGLFLLVAIFIIYSADRLNAVAPQTDKKIKSDSSLNLSGTRIDILYPCKNVNGSILVLPGWNFKCDDICKNSVFCELAKQKGYVLILPDMLKSVYASNLFPETRKDWIKYPTLTWITDTLIPYLQKNFDVLLPHRNNYLFGISTGARGVAMLSLYSSDIFLAGVALSGDYNQLEMPDDNLMKGYYGNIEQFLKRWEGTDNPLKNAAKLKIPLYLAHGKKDNIVPYYQTLEFYDTIRMINPGLGHTLNLNDTASHNYYFWQSEYENAFDFFERFRIEK